jgi:FkbM family methyltransferase
LGFINRILKPIVPEYAVRLRRSHATQEMAKRAGLRLVARDLFYDLERGGTVLRIRRSHAVYLHHMIENFDYYVDSVEPLQVDGQRVVDISGPRYHRLRGFADVPFLFPSHTEPYKTTSEYLEFAGLSEGMVVLDIGAYSGVTSIVFAQLVGPSGHVYAFEADETNYACAKVNIEMAERVMGLKNITLMQKAIWSHNDGILFSHEGAMGSSAVAITGGGRGTERIVPSTTLKNFFHENGLSQVDFIKVDIEGGEIAMLESSMEFLGNIKARMIVEPHWVGGQMSTERCRSLMESAGYETYVRGKVGESEHLIEAVPKKMAE